MNRRHTYSTMRLIGFRIPAMFCGFPILTFKDNRGTANFWANQRSEVERTFDVDGWKEEDLSLAVGKEALVWFNCNGKISRISKPEAAA